MEEERKEKGGGEEEKRRGGGGGEEKKGGSGGEKRRRGGGRDQGSFLFVRACIRVALGCTGRKVSGRGPAANNCPSTGTCGQTLFESMRECV